jgi:hypothetical protein
MSSAKSTGKLRPRARALPECLREFLTPAIWKQAQAARCASHPRRRQPRWGTQPLVLVVILISWCCGDSQPERFETAKAACAVSLAKRRRPGKTVQGFDKALARLPVSVLRTVAAGVRRRLQSVLDLTVDGWVPLGCDGSLLATPRAAELEQRLGDRGLKNSAPTVWVTALVHLRTGVLWAWRLGKGTASERVHLLHLLKVLPASTLLVADAGFNGYWLAQAILEAEASFLIRMSGKDFLYTDVPADRSTWSDGSVWLWPKTARADGQLPLALRLIRVRGKRGKQKNKDVWLLTNVRDSRRLSVEMAARYYRWRWENEGLFRTYKRTLAKVKLLSRTVRLVPREAEGALLATQLLLAQGARALPRRSRKDEPLRCSPRKVLCEIRKDLQAAAGARRRARLSRRLAQARREQRRRISAKVKRPWPRRVEHKPPKPPQFLTLSDKLKALRAKLESQKT